MTLKELEGLKEVKAPEGEIEDTVQGLIEGLKKLPPEAKVITWRAGDGDVPITRVVLCNDGKVWIS